jgi:hypothetical protein
MRRLTLVVFCIAAVVCVKASGPSKPKCAICKVVLPEKGFECQQRLNGRAVQVCFDHAWDNKINSLRKK